MPKVSEHELNMMSLTTQMRQNQDELSSFIKDLDGWEQNIKDKDEQLKQQKQQKPVHEQKLPPVRNSLDKKKKKKVKKKSDKEPATKPKKIRGYDYRSWDKFDVDKACEEVGDPDEDSKSSSEYETDEEWEQERLKQAAVMEKDKGNDYFKRNELDNAIECYTRGVKMDPTNPLLPANRAMALLKQDKFGAAEVDCTEALTFDPLYIKAYLRRATARIGLKKFNEAKEDCERVLQLEPQNKKAKSDVEKIEKELTKENLVSHTEPTSVVGAGIVKAIFKAPHERSIKPLRRIHIEDVGGEEAAERKAAIARTQAGQGETKRNVMEKDGEMFRKFTASSPADIGMNGPPQQSRETAPQSVPVDNGSSVVESSETYESKMKNSADKLSESKDDENDLSLRLGSLSTDTGREQKSKTEKKTVKQTSPREVTPKTSPRELFVPSTSFQFQADYKVLRNNEEAFYNYFKKITPEKYPKLFGTSLDAEVLLKILHMFKTFYIPNEENFMPHLQCLTKVQRFSMTAMFFSTKEKQVVKDLFHHLRSSGQHSDKDLTDLSKKYDMR